MQSETAQQREKGHGAAINRSGDVTEFYEGDCRVTLVPLTIAKRGAQCRLIPGDGTSVPKPTLDVPLVKALGNALYWEKELELGNAASPADLASQRGLDKTWVNETLRLTLLAPDIVTAILAGTQPRTLSLQTLRQHVPADWEEQRQLWKFD